jgi:hypothetical protein
MLEHRRAIPGDVFIEKDARISVAQQLGQRGLAIEKWAVAQILTIVLDQVEGKEDSVRAASRRGKSSKRDKPSGPSTTASPSIVKLLALIRPAAAAMTGSRTVQSWALRV